VSPAGMWVSSSGVVPAPAPSRNATSRSAGRDCAHFPSLLPFEQTTLATCANLPATRLGNCAARDSNRRTVLRASVPRAACAAQTLSAQLQLVGGAAPTRAVYAPHCSIVVGGGVVYRTRAAQRHHLVCFATQEGRGDDAPSISEVRRRRVHETRVSDASPGP